MPIGFAFADVMLDFCSRTVPVSRPQRPRPILPFGGCRASMLTKVEDVGVCRPDEFEVTELVSKPEEA